MDLSTSNSPFIIFGWGREGMGSGGSVRKRKSHPNHLLRHEHVISLSNGCNYMSYLDALEQKNTDIKSQLDEKRS